MARSDIETLNDELGKPLVALTAQQWLEVLDHIDTEIEAVADQARDFGYPNEEEMEYCSATLDSLKSAEDLRDAIREQLGLSPMLSQWDELRHGR